MSYHFSKTKHFILFLIGQIVVGFSIAFTTLPGLGTSPLTSFSYVTTFKIPWTFGTANIALMPADGLIKVMSEEYRISYETLKICFDSTHVIPAILFSLFCFHNITGIREGTLISAFLVGFSIRLQQKTMRKVKFLLLK